MTVTLVFNNTTQYDYYEDQVKMKKCVNENGVITAVADGTAEISIISDKGEIKDAVTIIVGSGFNCGIEPISTDTLFYADNTLAGGMTVTINNNSSNEQPSTVIMAVYDSKNRLVGIKSVPTLLIADANYVTIADVENGSYTVKCFVYIPQSVFA